MQRVSTFQDVESENLNVVKRLFKIQNLNASSIRMVMVADSPELLLEAGEKAEETVQGPTRPLEGESMEEEEEEDGGEDGEERDIVGEDAQIAAALQIFVDIDAQNQQPFPPPLTRDQLETKVAQLYAKYRTRRPNSPQNLEGSKKYLIFTTGCQTYSPHQIGTLYFLLLSLLMFHALHIS